CQFPPLSELRHRPRPTTLMVTSPFVRFTTTPEHPPGHGGLAPLLVKRSSNGLEISVHRSAASAEKPGAITQQVSSTTAHRNACNVRENTVFIIPSNPVNRCELVNRRFRAAACVTRCKRLNSVMLHIP